MISATLHTISAPVMWLGIAAMGAYVLAAVAARMQASPARLVLLVAWVLHALVLGAGLMGAPPHFGFAPAISMMMWLMLAVYAVELRLYPQLTVQWVLAALAALSLLLGLVFPGQGLDVHTSPLLPLHWALGIASYGLFAAAVVHALLLTRSDRQMRTTHMLPEGALPVLTLERLTFRLVTAGFILLTATILVGLAFGEELYGRALQWNHKTVFACLSWLVFAILLLGRLRFGWRGWVAVRMLYAGALLLLLAYVGSRFVLEVVLARGGV